MRAQGCALLPVTMVSLPSLAYAQADTGGGGAQNGENCGLFGCPVAVPEPATAALITLGVLGVAVWRHRK